MIKKHILNLPEPPLILDLTIMKKAKRKRTKNIQIDCKVTSRDQRKEN